MEEELDAILDEMMEKAEQILDPHGLRDPYGDAIELARLVIKFREAAEAVMHDVVEEDVVEPN